MQYLLISIVLLLGTVKAADTFIGQSISLAKKLKISGFIIGFTLVAFGTSLPEFIVSTYSTYTGHTDIAISNVLGSCIANITLVLGVLAVYKPYKLNKTDVFLNIPLSLFSLLFFVILLILNNFTLTVISGVILIVIVPFILLISKRNNGVHRIKSEVKFNLLILILSLIALIILGKYSVDYILKFSELFNIQESILGYFVMAIGTSLLELVAAFAAIRKGNGEMGIGNILGSNLINLYLIFGSSSLIYSINLSEFKTETYFLIFLTLLLVVLGFIGKKFFLSKREGLVLLITYMLFVIYQVL